MMTPGVVYTLGCTEHLAPEPYLDKSLTASTLNIWFDLGYSTKSPLLSHCSVMKKYSKTFNHSSDHPCSLTIKQQKKVLFEIRKAERKEKFSRTLKWKIMKNFFLFKHKKTLIWRKVASSFTSSMKNSCSRFVKVILNDEH